MQDAEDSCKRWIAIQNLDYLALVNESDVLVVPMRTYNLEFGLPWFNKRNPDIDRAHRRLTAPRSPRASRVEVMTPMTTAVASKVSEADNDTMLMCSPDIQTLGATAFDDLLSTNQVIAAFAPRIGECTGLLGAALEGIGLDSLGSKTKALNATSREQRQ
jgi:hypothetical protein